MNQHDINHRCGGSIGITIFFKITRTNFPFNKVAPKKRWISICHKKGRSKVNAGTNFSENESARPTFITKKGVSKSPH